MNTQPHWHDRKEGCLIKILSQATLAEQIVRADIRLDIRKITDVRVELSVQPRISTVKSALWNS